MLLMIRPLLAPSLDGGCLTQYFVVNGSQRLPPYTGYRSTNHVCVCVCYTHTMIRYGYLLCCRGSILLKRRAANGARCISSAYERSRGICCMGFQSLHWSQTTATVVLSIEPRLKASSVRYCDMFFLRRIFSALRI